MKSKLLALNGKDITRGFIMATTGAFLTGSYQLLNTGGNINALSLKPILMVSLGSGISYLIKNVFTNSKDELLTPEPKF